MKKVKLVVILTVLMLMTFQSKSQSILTKNQSRVYTYINEVGDTMVAMSPKDARIILEDILKYEYSDSLLQFYKEKDSLNFQKNLKQESIILKLSELTINQKQIIKNLEEALKYENYEGDLKDVIINRQMKDLKKCRLRKRIGFGSSIILTLAVLVLMI